MLKGKAELNSDNKQCAIMYSKSGIGFAVEYIRIKTLDLPSWVTLTKCFNLSSPKDSHIHSKAINYYFTGLWLAWIVKISVKNKHKSNKPPTTVTDIISRVRNISVPCSNMSLTIKVHIWKVLTQPEDLPFNVCFVSGGNLIPHSNKRGGKHT